METEQKDTKKKKIWPVFLILGIVILLLAGIGFYYYQKAIYYSDYFLPGTVINGVEVSDCNPSDVISLFDNEAKSVTLEVYGRDTDLNISLLGTITAEEAGYEYLGTGYVLQDFLQQQNPYLWFLYKYWPARFYSEYTFTPNESYDKDMLSKAVLSLSALQPENMKAPEDGYISSYEKGVGYSFVYPYLGNYLKRSDLEYYLKTEENLFGMEITALHIEDLDLYVENEKNYYYQTMMNTVERLNRMLSTSIHFQWGIGEVTLDESTIADWLRITSDYEPALDGEAIGTFVKENASLYDTYGKKHQFTTYLGEDISVRCKGYGWKTDKEATEELICNAIFEGLQGELEPVYTYEAYAKGSSDIGASYVEIDLTNQRLYLFYEGELVVESKLVSGNVSAGNTTPGGLFGLTYKTTDAILRGATYASHVDYWMPFNGNIGMHDASWRGSFGGEIYLTNGSHGCVNLPKSKAKTIYEYVEKNFPVICYYYSKDYTYPDITVAEAPVIIDETVVAENAEAIE